MAWALAYLGTLAFAGWVLWLRERRGDTVDAKLRKLDEWLESVTKVIRERRQAWDDAAAYVEAQNVAKGLRR